MDVSDLDGDGDVDLVALDWERCNNGRFGWPVHLMSLLNDGRGRFQEANKVVFHSGPPRNLRPIDGDNDGVTDILAAVQDRVMFLRGRENGYFDQAIDLRLGGTPTMVEAGDFDGDGIPELLVPGAVPDTLACFHRTETGSYARAPFPLIEGAVTWVTTGDLNADGRLDVVAIRANPVGAMIVEGRGGGAFGAPIEVDFGIQLNRCIFADLAGDGNPDIIVADAGGVDGWRLVRGLDGGYRALRLGVGVAQTGVAAGDLNGDGQTDIVFAAGAGHIPVFMNCSGDLFPRSDIRAAVKIDEIGIADLNRDGRPELLANFIGGLNQGMLQILWNQGSYAVTRNHVDGLSAERTQGGVLVKWIVQGSGPPDRFRVLRSIDDGVEQVLGAEDLVGHEAFSLLDGAVSVEPVTYWVRQTTSEGWEIRNGPVKLEQAESVLSFRATRRGATVEITWAVAEPARRDVFRLRRSDSEGESTDLPAGPWTGLDMYRWNDTEPPAYDASYTLIETLPAGTDRVHGPVAAADLGTPGTELPERLTLDWIGASPGTGPITAVINLPFPTTARVGIVDPVGRGVRSLFRGYLVSGVHEWTWDGRDDAGRPVPSGLYLLRAEAAREVQVRRIVRLNP